MTTKNVFYEILPFLYSAGGVAVIILSNESIGKASGILLISAALIVFRLRLEYRKQRAEDAEEELHYVKRKFNKERTSN